MANRLEWERYNSLKNTIADAISDAVADADMDDCDAPLKYVIFISENLENAVCFIDISDEQELALIENYDDWHYETATSYEDAINIANNYFDLR